MVIAVGDVSEKNIAKINPDGNWVDTNAPPAKRVREQCKKQRMRTVA